MKHKTSELTGALLDAAVAKAIGDRIDGLHAIRWIEGLPFVSPAVTCDDNAELFTPSTDWAHGGPIIEREWINLHATHIEDWRAWIDPNGIKERGETALIAAMRSYVASKLGDEVDL